MLNLHEDLLAEVKVASKGAQAHRQNTAAALKTSKHSRWHSNENLEGKLTGKASQVMRRPFDLHWPLRSRDDNLGTYLQEAVEIAKIFERMVNAIIL